MHTRESGEAAVVDSDWMRSQNWSASPSVIAVAVGGHTDVSLSKKVAISSMRRRVMRRSLGSFHTLRTPRSVALCAPARSPFLLKSTIVHEKKPSGREERSVSRARAATLYLDERSGVVIITSVNELEFSNTKIVRSPRLTVPQISHLAEVRADTPVAAALIDTPPPSVPP